MPTKIEWADEVWNITTGCTPISAGCQNCYAKRMAQRLKGRAGYPADDPFKVTFHPDKLDAPLRWKKPRRIFVVSMGDLFHEDVTDEMIDKVFAIMASSGRHTFMLLTKRPQRAHEWFQRVSDGAKKAKNMYQSALIDYYSRNDVDLSEPHQVPAAPTGELRFIYDSMRDIKPEMTIEERFSGKSIGECHWRGWPLDNVWLGVTAENQAMADERIPILLQIPAAKHFASLEPLLKPVDVRPYLPRKWTLACHDYPTERTIGLDGIVAGGESGPGARPSHPDWFRKVRDDCAAAGVPFTFKQWGEFVPKSQTELRCPDKWGCITQLGSYYPETSAWNGHDDDSGESDAVIYRVGKKAAGRELDGVIHDGWPGE